MQPCMRPSWSQSNVPAMQRTHLVSVARLGLQMPSILAFTDIKVPTALGYLGKLVMRVCKASPTCILYAATRSSRPTHQLQVKLTTSGNDIDFPPPTLSSLVKLLHTGNASATCMCLQQRRQAYACLLSQAPASMLPQQIDL